MTDREYLKQLVAAWYDAHSNGRSISLTELCVDRPDLFAPLRDCIARMLQGMQVLQSNGGDVSTADFIDDLCDTVSVSPPPKSSSVSRSSLEGRKGKFAEFELKGILGEGGFGTVYRAEDTRLHRKVAIKVMHDRALQREGARESFLAEAKALASVQNDHVVPIFQVGEAEGQLFLVMPLLAGETLASRLERIGALPITEVRRIGCEIAAGLAAIHAKGLIHRDLKPANIWLEADTHRVKVLDLGLAQDSQATSESLTGTPAYMSPEQAANEELDFRSDLFSLGAVLYECATGRRAFLRSSVTETLRAISEESPPAPSKVNPAVPGQLSTTIEQLLRKDPAGRPDSASELQALLRNQQLFQPTPSTTSKATQYWAMLAGATLVVLLLGSVYWLFIKPNSETTANRGSSDKNTTTVTSTEIGAPRIADFDITHFARVEDGAKVENRGIFGKTTFIARQKDLVTLDVTLTRPAYTYLLAFRPDGVMELCYPEEETRIPPLSAKASYPSESASRSKGYGLSESPGLWVFTAIVSESPLSSFQDWKREHPLPLLKSATGVAGVVLVDDGQSIDQLRSGGALRATRGKGEEIPGQRALEAVGDAIKQAAPHVLVRSIGIVAIPEG